MSRGDEPGSGERGAAPRGRQRRLLVIAAVLLAAGLLLLAAAGLALYVRGGGPLPSWAAFLRPSDRAVLDPSSPAEVVLRTLRLAGYERAVVGESAGTVVVRLEAPITEDTGDVALTWQTALAAASEAYPRAKRLVAQVFANGQALLEVSASGDDVRAAVKKDDAEALRKASTFRYLSEAGR